jgi:hypothetical protein
MFLDITDDQAALLSTVSAILSRAGTAPVLDGNKSSFDIGLDKELETNGVFDTATYPDFGPSAAALVVHEVCRNAGVVEVAASALIRPLVCPEAPRPLAVLHGDPSRAARFLAVARAVLLLSDTGASWCPVSPDDIEIVEAYFAYPMGRLRAPREILARAKPCADPALASRLASLAVAAEITGVLQGGLDSVIVHVSDRRQFGRPLGAFQTVQHRLAACASRIAAAKWLTLKAGGSGTLRDISAAAAYAQEMVDAVTYDLHQFMGAMGLTLEHPLHRWTYRAKLLKSELGGTSRHYRELADAAWA